MKTASAKVCATKLSKTYPLWLEGHKTSHVKASNEITDSSLLATITNHF
jgi:hypothetical protein